MGASHRFGRRAEDQVAAWLSRRGWTILERNWRFHHKEIDLIALRDGTVVFVEVKARDARGWGHPLETITPAKRRDLATAARAWVASRGSSAHVYRFDAAVVMRRGPSTEVEYFEDAWRL